MRKFFNILAFIVLFLWQLPQNLIAIVMMPFMGNMDLLDYRNYCFGFRCKNMHGGISLGSFAFLSRIKADQPAVIAHEMDGHTVDSKILGPLYLIIIGLPSLLWALFRNQEKHPDYYTFWTERLANRRAGVISVPYTDGKYYHLVFKNNTQKQ